MFSKFDILKGRVYPVDLDFELKENEIVSIRFESKVIRDVFLLSLARKGNLRFNNKFFDINKLRGMEIYNGVFYRDIEILCMNGYLFITYSTELDTPKHFDDLAFFDMAKNYKWEYEDNTIIFRGNDSIFNRKEEIIINV